jgi:hypothetical protein
LAKAVSAPVDIFPKSLGCHPSRAEVWAWKDFFFFLKPSSA